MLPLIENDMSTHISHNTIAIYKDILMSERTWLVYLCTHLTRNQDVAEDLAQETLLEAWKNQHKLYNQHDTAGRRKWLAAVARNVCKRWTRTYGHDVSHLIPFQHYQDEMEQTIEDTVADDYDIEIELERDELASLLDRALALLPPTTRDVLIERYIHESSRTEIMARLGLNEDALEQRLYRGKLALRRVITTYMSEEAEAYGLSTPCSIQDELAQETRIWCPMCSKGRLIKYRDSATKRTGFTCPQCWHIAATQDGELHRGVHSPKAILTRQLAFIGAYYWQAIQTGQVSCPACGLPAHTRIYTPQDSLPECYLPSVPGCHKIFIQCSGCDYEEVNPIPHLILDLPEVRPFWRKHPRMQWQPGSEIEYKGQTALVCSFQSITDAAHLDVIYRPDTLNVLTVRESTH